MARIYPQHIPDSERKAKFDRRAEHLVYDYLSKLSDDWLVLYGTAIKRAHSRGVSDREADFIVAHPQLGVLMLEVKGGSISREGNMWYSTPIRELSKPEAQRIRHQIKNPYVQATDAAKDYERKLDDYIKNNRLPQRTFRIATAVCFPDIEIPDDCYLGSEALPEITLDRRDLPDIEKRLCQILRLHQGKNDPPGEEGLALLKDVLARDWHIESFLAYEIREAERRRIELTEEQFQVLFSLEDNPQVLIAGCAGSGKTLLAAEKARRMAQLGHRVLLTCFNRNLAEWLSRSPFGLPDIYIADFHTLCMNTVRTARKTHLPDWSETLGVDRGVYFGKMMPEALRQAAAELNFRFDTIIVDEGQDFEPLWLEVLHELLSDPQNGIFYLFYDDNQKIYDRGRIPFKWPCYRLTRNMRNTNPVFELVRRYYQGLRPISPSGIPGPDPEFVPMANFANEYEAVENVLERLTAQRISLSQIAILTPSAKEKSIWGQPSARSRKFAFTWSLEPVANQVTCCTIHGFKGLERDVIILTEIQRLPVRQKEELLYVAISRAKTHLIVIGNLP